MRRAEAGLLLLEAMVALVLLGLAVVAMLQLLSGTADAAARARVHTEALALAQSELDRLVSSAAVGSLAAEETEGAFPPPFERYRYAVTSARVGEQRLIEIRVRITWPELGAGAVDLLTRTVPGVGEAGR